MLTVTEFPIVTELELSVGLLALGIVDKVCEYDCSFDDKGVSMLIQAEQVSVFVPSLLWYMSRVLLKRFIPESVIFWLGETVAE